jgi:hypothetical protein
MEVDQFQKKMQKTQPSMRRFFLCIITFLQVAFPAISQHSNISSNNTLDSLCKRYVVNKKDLAINAQIYSFGKSNSKEVFLLDSIGSKKGKIYNTSLLISIGSDSNRYYIPVRGKVFTKWYQEYGQNELPVTFKLLLKSHRPVSKTDLRCFLTIEQIHKFR